MKSGDFGYLLGTNIEFGIKCVGREVYECSFRRGRVFRPFSAKNKSTEIRPGDAQRLFRQDVPFSLYSPRASLRGVPVLDAEPSELVTNELEWTERRVLDPCYFEEKRRTRRAGKNVTFYRYNRLGRTWSYLSQGRVLYLWVHGLRQLCLPVSRVEGEVVTFSTQPVLRAHASVCRLCVTKSHLGCRVNRVSHFQPYRSPFGDKSEFDIGWLYGTCLHLQCVHRDGVWSLCVANRDYYGRLLWVPNELVCTCSRLPVLDVDEDWHYTGRKVYLHGLPTPWYECEGATPSSVVRVYPRPGQGEVFGDGSIVVCRTILETTVRWESKKDSKSAEIRRRRRNCLAQCFY